MKSFPKYLLFIPVFFIVASCSEKEYVPVPKDQDLIATINIKDMTVTFVDIDTKKKIAQWEMEKPYSGGLILPDQDTLLLFGKQVDTVDLYSLSTGRLKTSWDTGKGIVNGILLKNKKKLFLLIKNKIKLVFSLLMEKKSLLFQQSRNPFTILEGKTSYL